MPHLTAAGPIDLSADWAVCCETWHEKRQHPGLKLNTVTSVTSVTDDITDLLERYDAFLDRVHSLAYPAPDLFDVSEASGRSEPSTDESSGFPEWSSRPSLNLSISTGPSSDDSHPVVKARQSVQSVSSEAPAPAAVPAPAPAIARSKGQHKPNLSIDTTVCAVRRNDIEATTDSPDESPTTARQPRPRPLPRPSTPASPAMRRFDSHSHTRSHPNPHPPHHAHSPSLAIPIPHPPMPSMTLPTSPLSPPPRDQETQRTARRRRPTLPSFKLLGRGNASEPPPPVPPMPWQQLGGGTLSGAGLGGAGLGVGVGSVGLGAPRPELKPV